MSKALILIGQYDSSFVRRVAIAMKLYGLGFQHRPWSVFGDAERLAEINPLMRVPTLVLDDGTVLADSTLIIQHIDAMMPAEARLWPEAGNMPRALRIFGLASGLAEKAVSLFYEKVLHETPAKIWAERCQAQILATLAALEAERAASTGNYFFGERMGHADIAVTCAIAHAVASHPELIDIERYPALADHCRMMEGLPVFREIYQEFIPPA